MPDETVFNGVETGVQVVYNEDKPMSDDVMDLS